jgi:RND family efflux transporter MFP subunit
MNQEQHLASLRRAGPSSGRGKKKHLGSLFVLLAFVAGAALVFVLVFGKRLQPRVPVSVVPALLLESEEVMPTPTTDSSSGSVLAQASGWVEPDPFAVRVPVKVDGFVEEVLVYAGDTVKRGQLLATLDATNYVLRVEHLAASLEEARRDRAVAEAQTAIAEARHHEAEDRLQRIQTLDPGDLSEVEVVAAERAGTEARSEVEARRAAFARQEARVAVLQTQLEQARVDLSRTRVLSPMDGMVLKRFAAPGMKRMAAMDDPDSATIVSLYDPGQLQVRVDVPLSDAGRMVTGMPARVVTAALAGRVFTGHITRITGEADIARNTLQVKVALDEPDLALRPEMLCRVEFFAPAASGPRASARARQVWLSESALDGSAAGAVTVWVVDPVAESVAPRDIEVGAESRDGLRIVYRGLRPGEQVVAGSTARLEPGSRVLITRD